MEAIPETEVGTKLFNMGLQVMYDGNFDNIINIAENAPPEKLGASLASIIVETIVRLEKDNPELKNRLELVAEVGSRLLEALITDLLKGKLQINETQFMEAIANVISDYGLSHPETISQEDMQNFLKELSQKGRQQPLGQQPQQQPQQEQQPQQPPGLLQRGPQQ